MGKVFNIPTLTGTFNNAKDKAIALAGEMGLNGALGGRVLPPLPPFPKTAKDGVADPDDWELETIAKEKDNAEMSIFGTPMCFPLSIKLTTDGDKDWWLLPTEPMISISGGNVITRRNVAKVSGKDKALRGTIKERWAQDDYNISIDGLFTRHEEWKYPDADVRKLRGMLESRKAINVKCQLFEIFGIDRIVVEKFDIPFTKGEENQSYSISAYSDDDWDLLLPLN